MATPGIQAERTASARTVSWAHDNLSLSYREIGAVLDVDERTVRRWQKAETTPRGEHRDRLESLRELRHLLGEVFSTPAEAQEWLHSSVPAFRGRSPISLIRAGRTEEVIQVLATIESGAYI
ncbi:MAG: antitoxin Xre/MbcA/ParS toxin-binding domain-containing protein [bacterium]